MIVIGELTLERAKKALEGTTADILYTDPPWGPRLLQYFRTLNGEKQEVYWTDFLKVFAEVVAKSTTKDSHIFIEMGLQWVSELTEALAKEGVQASHRWTALYSSPKKPNAVLYAGPGVNVDLNNLSGKKLISTALKAVAKPGNLVFDPCCGKGMTAKAAVLLGLKFAGVELNPARAQVAIDYLNR